MVDSRWTFTVVAAELLEAGASSVCPFALVKTGQWGLNEREIHRRAEDSQIDKH